MSGTRSARLRRRSARLCAVLGALLVLAGGADLLRAAVGDANGDGQLTSADARRILEALIELPPPLSAQQRSDADVDRDGVLSIVDAQLVEQVVARQLPGFPVPRPQHSGPIALSRDGSLLAVVQPDADRVTLLETAAEQVIAELPVGREPTGVAFSRDGEQLLVTNARSASVSVLDTSTLASLGEIAVGVEPAGIAVSYRGDRAFVANLASGTVSVIDLVQRREIAAVPVADKPQALAITADGAKIFVTHLTGDRVSVIDGATLGVRSLVLASSPFDRANPAVPAGVPNRTKSLAIHPTRAEAWVAQILSNKDNTAETLFNTTVFPALSLIDTAAEQELGSRRITLFRGLQTIISSPEGVAFSPDGNLAYVTAASSNDLVVLDATSRQEIGLLRDVADHPRGIVIHPDGRRAYVYSRLTPEVSVVDLQQLTLQRRIPVGTDPLPPSLANGRRLFFTSALPEVAQNRFLACESCHFDGRDDGLIWHFTNGPRQTLSMAGGTLETGLLHHNGDRANLQDFATTFTRLQNGTGLTPDQLDDLADWVNQGLRFLENPFLGPGRERSAAARRGRRVFAAAQCAPCHPAPFFTDARGHVDIARPFLHQLGILAEGTGTRDEFDNTRDQAGVAGGTLRPAGAFESTFLLGLWATPPYLHDGRAATLGDVLTTANPGDIHGATSQLTAQQCGDLVAYLRELDISGSRVQIERPADASRVVRLSEVSGSVLPDVIAVDVYVAGRGPLQAVVADGHFRALVPPALVPPGSSGQSFEVSARARTASGEPGRDDIEARIHYDGVVSAARTTVEVAPALIAAGGSEQARVTIRPRDAAGELVGSGLAITAQTTLGTLSAVTDAGDGSYTTTLRASIGAGTASITANETAAGRIGPAVTVRIAAGDVDAQASAFAVSPGTLEATPAATARITVTPRDAFGNPLGAGQSVSVQVDRGSLGPVADAGDGTYTAEYRAPTATGTATFSARVNGVALAAAPRVSLVADVTAPAAGDFSRIRFSAPQAGASEIAGGAGAVEAFAQVTLTNTATGATITVAAAADGSFRASLLVAANQPVSLRVRDAAGNTGAVVSQVPFAVQTFAVRGIVQTARPGGGFSPVAGALIELDVADLSDACNPAFTPIFFAGRFLTAVSGADGRFEIALPAGFVPDPNLAVVSGPDANHDGTVDDVVRFARVNDVERDVQVDALSTELSFLICDNGALLGVPNFPSANFTPAESARIELAVREATAELDLFGLALGGTAFAIEDDVFFDQDGPKDALDQVAVAVFRSAAESPGEGPAPRIARGLLTLPSAGGPVPLAGALVELVTIELRPSLRIAVVPGATALTDARGAYALPLPAFVTPGAQTAVAVFGDLRFATNGLPGALDVSSPKLSLGAFVADPAQPVDADLAGFAAIRLLAAGQAPIANYSPLEVAQLTALVRSKAAALATPLAGRLLSEVFDAVFAALLQDADVLALLTSIADAEGNACLVSAAPGPRTADGVSPVAIRIEPIDVSLQRLGRGRVLGIRSNLGTVTSPALDNPDGTYTALLRAPVAPGTASITIELDGQICPQQPAPVSIAFTADTTAPAAPDASRLVLRGGAGGSVTLVGLPGSVEAFARLTVRNTTRGLSFELQAGVDGSFRADLAGSASDQFSIALADGAGNVRAAAPLALPPALALPAVANPGALPAGVRAALRPLAESELGAPVPSGYSFLAGFALQLEGGAPTAALEVLHETSRALAPGQQALLVQVIDVLQRPALRVVAEAHAAGGVLLPARNAEFPGVRTSGRYAYLQPAAAQAFMTGRVVNRSAQPIADVRLGLSTSPFLDLSRLDGSYLLAGPVGTPSVASAALFAHEPPVPGPALQLPFAGAVIATPFSLPTRARRATAFASRFLDLPENTRKIALIPSGSELFTISADRSTGRIVDTGSLTAVSSFSDSEQISDLAFTPNGSEAQLALRNYARDFTLSIEEPGLQLRNVQFPLAVAVRSDGDVAVIVSSSDGKSGDTNPDALFALDPFSNEVEPNAVPLPPDPTAVALNRAGTRAYVLARASRTLTVVDLANRAPLTTLLLDAEPAAIAVSPEGDELYLALPALNTVRVLDAARVEDTTAGNELVANIPVGAGPDGLVISRDGRQLYASETPDDTVSVIDAATLAVVDVWATLNRPISLAPHPDGTRVYVLGPGDKPRVLEVAIADADRIPPAALDAGPHDRARELLQDSPLEIVFDEKMDVSTFTTAHIGVSTESGTPLSGSFSASGDGVAAVFTPAAGVRYPLNSRLRVSLGTGLRDAQGVALAAATTRFVPTFTMQLPNPLLLSLDLTPAGVVANGRPGAVEPGSLVDIANRTTGRSFSAAAGNDGSFSIPVFAVDSERVELTTSLFGGRARSEPVALPAAFSLRRPDPARITFSPGAAGVLQVSGSAGAVDPATTLVRVSDETTGSGFETTAAADGSFSLGIFASSQDRVVIVTTIARSFDLQPVALSLPFFPVPTVESLSPTRASYGSATRIALVGSHFGSDPAALRVDVGPAQASGLSLDVLDEDPSKQVIQFSVPALLGSQPVQVRFAGQLSEQEILTVQPPAFEGLGPFEILSASTAGDPTVLLPGRSGAVDLGRGGSLTLRLGTLVVDGPGFDFQVQTTNPECYVVDVSGTASGPYVSLGRFCGSSLLNLGGAPPARFVRITDANDNPASSSIDDVSALRVQLTASIQAFDEDDQPIGDTSGARPGGTLRAAVSVSAVESEVRMCASSGKPITLKATQIEPPLQTGSYYGPRCRDDITWTIKKGADVATFPGGQTTFKQRNPPTSKPSVQLIPKGGKGGRVEINLNVTRVNEGSSGSCPGEGSTDVPFTVDIVKVEIMNVISDQISGVDCNANPAVVTGIDAGNPFLMGATSGTTTNVRVRAKVEGGPGVTSAEIVALPLNGKDVLGHAKAAASGDTKLEFDARNALGRYVFAGAVDSDKDGMISAGEVCSPPAMPQALVANASDVAAAGPAFLSLFTAQGPNSALLARGFQSGGTPAGATASLRGGMSLVTPGDALHENQTRPNGHPVGQRWSSACTADVPVHLFGNASAIATKLRSSGQVKGELKDLGNIGTLVTFIKSQMAGVAVGSRRTFNLQNGAGQTNFIWGQITKNEWINVFDPLNIDRDLAFSLGDIAIRGTLSVTFERQSRILRSDIAHLVSIAYTAEIEDFYDFDFFDTLNQEGATLQAGFGTVGGAGGRTSITRIEFADTRTDISIDVPL